MTCEVSVHALIIVDTISSLQMTTVSHAPPRLSTWPVARRGRDEGPPYRGSFCSPLTDHPLNPAKGQSQNSFCLSIPRGSWWCNHKWVYGDVLRKRYSTGYMWTDRRCDEQARRVYLVRST